MRISADINALERHIEVKGRNATATTVTVTRNEKAMPATKGIVLALVFVDGRRWMARYVTDPFDRDPGHGESVSITISIF